MRAGIRFAQTSTMIYQCQHCGQLVAGKTYRVTSEESGITLLDMVVCYYCFLDAQRLGLHAEELRPSEQPRSHV
jgi:DNA-directed RNA polymerase subunit RPC12/RpoP